MNADPKGLSIAAPQDHATVQPVKIRSAMRAGDMLAVRRMNMPLFHAWRP